MVSLSTGKGSEQSVGTPRVFLDAVERCFGKIAFDLAASADNAVVPDYYDEATDSLKQDWSRLNGVLWLNPPFANIAPWVKKASGTDFQGKFLCLLPAGFRTEWYRAWCKDTCNTLILQGYFEFVGKPGSFPKDLMLLRYPYDPALPKYDLWDWRNET